MAAPKTARKYNIRYQLVPWIGATASARSCSTATIQFTAGTCARRLNPRTRSALPPSPGVFGTTQWARRSRSAVEMYPKPSNRSFRMRELSPPARIIPSSARTSTARPVRPGRTGDRTLPRSLTSNRARTAPS